MNKDHSKSAQCTAKTEQPPEKQVRYRIREGYSLREIAGEYLAIPVLLSDDADSKVAILNESGQFLWEQLREEKTPDELVRAMTDCYEVSKEEALTDIIEFLNQLNENHLLMKMEKRK